MALRILRVGNDTTLNQQFSTYQASELHDVTFAVTAEEAVQLLKRQAFDVLFTDAELPSLSGLELLAWIQRQQLELSTFVVTAANAVKMAVTAIKNGAEDVLTLPVSNETLNRSIQAANDRVSKNEASVKTSNSPVPLVAESLKMRKLLDQARAIAPFNTTVLITGESGTGKEVVARTIHEHSPRRPRPFVALNCAAIPDQLLEDELFGHVKGAFTGAQSAREGRFEHAHGGTLFLDEIGDMSLPLQAKLLRVLQEREFEKLGSSRTVKVDVRVIAATSADLEQKIKDGTFRLDLFYRLNVVHLRLAPLRERPEDISALATHWLNKFCQSAGLPPKQIDAEVMQALLNFHWPGNVRQLQNAMECSAALSGMASSIYVWDLPPEIRECASQVIVNPLPMNAALLSQQALPLEGVSLDAVVTNIERELLLRSLNQTGGNKMQAAKLLHMKRTTFVEKLKRLQIEDVADEITAELPEQATPKPAFKEFAKPLSHSLPC